MKLPECKAKKKNGRQANMLLKSLSQTDRNNTPMKSIKIVTKAFFFILLVVDNYDCLEWGGGKK